MQLVQDRSSHLIRFKCQVQMHTGQSIRADRIKTRKFQLPLIGDANVQLALQSYLAMIRALTMQIDINLLAECSFPIQDFPITDTQILEFSGDLRPRLCKNLP
jgi:hypothetical protein